MVRIAHGKVFEKRSLASGMGRSVLSHVVDLETPKMLHGARMAASENAENELCPLLKVRLWEVTSAGQELYQRASQMVAEVDELDADFLQVGQATLNLPSLSMSRTPISRCKE